MEYIQFTFIWWDFSKVQLYASHQYNQICLIDAAQQEKFQLKSGRLRNVTIASHKLKNIPVYERGGKCIRSLFK